ncbi:MAG: hypothetical protein R3F49_13765 [Planctomycetota bacterium]
MSPAQQHEADGLDARRRGRSRFGLVRLLLAEAAARVLMLSSNSSWRDPERYGHALVGDDYWLLAGRWDSFCAKIDPRRIHDTLGWTQGPLGPQNPMGLVDWTTARLRRDGRRKVMFYGDSFVSGHASEACWLPTLLEERLEGVDVVHLGVGGYGPDQMHLLARETIGLVDRPEVILMGLLTYSFDRVAQRVRSYQKPVVVPRSDGTLDVDNVPICRDPRRYFRRTKLSFRSYVRAARRRREDPPERDDYGFAGKVELNRAIVRANVRLARDVGARLVYVLFHDVAELSRMTARRQFFVEALAAEGVELIDTAPVVLDYARRQGIDPSELYVNAHHNDLGNRVVCEGLASALKSCGLEPRNVGVSA